MSNLLSESNRSLQPENFGWLLTDGDLIANKYLNIIPDKYCKTCACSTGCISNHCSCQKNHFKCTDHCLCKNCKNQ